MAEKGLLIVISSPSGGGKTTVVDEMLKKHTNWSRSISMTTREPRGEEKDGIDYFFVSRDAFEVAKDAGELLEWAEIYGKYYGTPKKPILESLNENKNVFLTIDVQGARQIAKEWDDPKSLLTLFIVPPSIEVLRERLERRGTETSEQIERRLAEAGREIEAASEYKRVVHNQNVEQTVNDIESVIAEFKKNQGE